MGFVSLNIGSLAPQLLPQTAKAPTGVELVTNELGATGTPIFGGFLREQGEYNAELTGLAAVRTYERMRRSDGQVSATLAAIKLPIRGAEWKIVAPDDATPAEIEAAELVESCLFDELDFDSIVSNALLQLDFGCAVHENVWYSDGKNVRLKKCAPRLPLTFYRWLTSDTGDDLVALEQMGYRGSQYIVTQIPAEKLCVFTFQKEGANFTGMALLRSMYQHWYVKNGLYKVEAIAAERNGMGVPWVKAGADAKKEDREAAIKWLQSLSVNEKTSILLPPGWEFGLEGVKGTIQSPKDAIEHHNAMITKSALAQFMDLGGHGSAGGNRALGQTMSDFFYLSLQALANSIARQITLRTIQPLCDYNFAGIRCPKLIPQNILSTKFEVAVDALQKLASGAVNVIQPDDDLEAWARNKLGAPSAGAPRQRPAAAPPVANASTAQTGTEAPGEKNTSADRTAMSEAGLFKPTREPRGAEKFLALSEMSSRLDRGRDEIAAALRKARPRLQAEIVHKLFARPIRDAHRVSIELDGKLVSEIEGILGEMADYGANTVAEERSKQLDGAKAPDAAAIRCAGAKRDPLGVYADGVVGEFTNTLQARATNVVLDQRRNDRAAGEQILQANEDLDDQADGWIDNVAAKGANEAFAAGRSDGYDQYRDEISKVLYSALLDGNTCDQCSEADGEEGETEDDVTPVPNPDCEGGDKCRCVHVYVFGDEGGNS